VVVGLKEQTGLAVGRSKLYSILLKYQNQGSVLRLCWVCVLGLCAGSVCRVCIPEDRGFKIPL
jgi:hypothetical protein